MSAVEKQIESLLERIMEASNQTVITAYEQKIEELERKRLLMAEKLENKNGVPRQVR